MSINLYTDMAYLGGIRDNWIGDNQIRDENAPKGR
jgi:hypothetical protein